MNTCIVWNRVCRGGNADEERIDKEVKKKLREEVTVPKCVDEGIQRAYDMIGISGEKKVIRRRKRIWPAAAAVAALTAGISITAVAVNYYLKFI